MLGIKRMTYDTIFARSFSKRDQKKLGYGAFFGCFIIALTFCTVFKPYLGPLRGLKLQLSIGSGNKIQVTTDEITKPLQPYDSNTKPDKPVCDTKQPRADVCKINGDARIDGNSSTIFLASTEGFAWNNSWTIRPYARKGDSTVMGKIRKLTVRMVQDSQRLPICRRNFSVPAVVFSTGGYAGNHFHDFTDILIPLYLTSREFDGEVQFLIANKNSRWIAKYKTLLEKLSKYDFIDIDKEINEVLCFPAMIVGLKSHKEFSIDPSVSPYSMTNFTQFLRSTYSLKRKTAGKLEKCRLSSARPRLLVIARRRTRRLTNADELAEMARSLGFEVFVNETTSNVPQTAKFVNSFDVMMGVHGAGLTNMVFLPKNAVVIQIIPLGAMEWLARTAFEVPAEDMNLKYLDYKISVNESSLIQQYPPDHKVLRPAMFRGGWYSFKKTYLDNQDVKLDVDRFRPTLLTAFALVKNKTKCYPTRRN